MKWKDVKEKIECLGVKDDDEILYIDIHACDGLDFKAEYDTLCANWEIS